MRRYAPGGGGGGGANLRCFGVVHRERMESRPCGGRVMSARCVARDVGVEPSAWRTRTDVCRGARGSGMPVNTAVTGSDGMEAHGESITAAP